MDYSIGTVGMCLGLEVPRGPITRVWVIKLTTMTTEVSQTDERKRCCWVLMSTYWGFGFLKAIMSIGPHPDLVRHQTQWHLRFCFFLRFLFEFFPLPRSGPPQFQLGDLGRYKPAGLSGAVANTLLAYLEPRNRGVWWLQMSLYFCWTKSENWNCMWKLFKIFISGMF